MLGKGLVSGGDAVIRGVTVEFRLLGPLEALHDVASLALGAKQRALLAILFNANEAMASIARTLPPSDSEPRLERAELHSVAEAPDASPRS